MDGFGWAPETIRLLQVQVAVHEVLLLEPAQALADLAGAHSSDALDLFELGLGGPHERLEAVEVLDDVRDHDLRQTRDLREDAVAARRDRIVDRRDAARVAQHLGELLEL